MHSHPWFVQLIGLWFGLASAGVCQQPGDEPSWFVAEPCVYQNPIESTPLVAIVQWQASVEGAITKIEIEGGGQRWSQSVDLSADAGQRLPQVQRAAILGLQPATDYRLRIVLSARQQQQFSQWLDYRTPQLPANFPPLHVEVHPALAASPGVTLFACNLWIADESMLDYGYILAVDQHGQVVWFCQTQERIADLRLLNNGNLLYQHGNYQILREIDWLGQPMRTWYASNLTDSPAVGATAVAVDTMHHDVIELPSGNFLTLATKLELFDRFPGSETDTSAAWKKTRVVCDEIIEFQPEDGAIVQRFPLKNVLDPERIGYMSLSNFWRDKYDAADDAQDPSRDWSHANALLYDPSDRTVLVSIRHLDCVLKMDWPGGKLRWILGDPDGWGQAWQSYLLTPQGEFSWFYHQHSPQWTDRGLLLYDNGNYRARPFAPRVPAEKNRTRVVEYMIDEPKRTVRQRLSIEEFGSQTVYCPFYGEAEWIDEGRRLLVTHGGHIEREDGTPMDLVPGERQWADIIELDLSSSQIAWRLRLDSGQPSRYGWSIYRSLRMDSLPSPRPMSPLPADADTGKPARLGSEPAGKPSQNPTSPTTQTSQPTSEGS